MKRLVAGLAAKGAIGAMPLVSKLSCSLCRASSKAHLEAGFLAAVHQQQATNWMRAGELLERGQPPVQPAELQEGNPHW